MHLIPRADLQTLMPKIAGWLDDGGIFCATFVGTRDSWAPTPWRATVVRMDEVVELTSGLEAIRLDELEYDGANVLGQRKHWHTLRCLSASSRVNCGYSIGLHTPLMLQETLATTPGHPSRVPHVVV
jgi:hypothetical protein